jgi:hypothetical protein
MRFRFLIFSDSQWYFVVLGTLSVFCLLHKVAEEVCRAPAMPGTLKYLPQKRSLPRTTGVVAAMTFVFAFGI